MYHIDTFLHGKYYVRTLAKYWVPQKFLGLVFLQIQTAL